MSVSKREVYMTKDTQKGNILSFFSNPAVGVAGSLASIIGVALAVYFYLASSKAPDITCYTHPVRATLVRLGTSSNLSVYHGEDVITSDLTAVQIAIWNRGGISVRRAQILKPLVIKTESEIPIIEATLRKQSRDVVNTDLDLSKLGEGQVTVSWEIMEKNDGCILQIIYMGDYTENFEFEGVFEGQKNPSVIKYFKKLKKVTDQYESPQRYTLRIGWIFVGLGLLLLTLLIVTHRRFIEKKSIPRGLHYSFLGYSLFMILYGIFKIVFRARDLGPPFGF